MPSAPQATAAAGLPAPEQLATMVSSITKTMFGISFALATADGPPRASFRTAVLPIPGPVPVSVVLSSDEASCAALGAAMFTCPVEEVDPVMIEDTLRELANIAAGHVKRAMALDQALGLPRIVAGAVPLGASSNGPLVLLRASQLELQVRVSNCIL